MDRSARRCRLARHLDGLILLGDPPQLPRQGVAEGKVLVHILLVSQPSLQGVPGAPRGQRHRMAQERHANEKIKRTEVRTINRGTRQKRAKQADKRARKFWGRNPGMVSRPRYARTRNGGVTQMESTGWRVRKQRLKKKDETRATEGGKRKVSLKRGGGTSRSPSSPGPF